MPTIKLIYVAGALRGPTPLDVTRNVLAALGAGLEVARAGAMPVVPHAGGAQLLGQLTEDFWLAGTRELLRRCDGVYVFNQRHLETSAGTRAEVAEAQQLGLPVFFDIAAIAPWLAGKAAA
jgi:hypothetical protein